MNLFLNYRLPAVTTTSTLPLCNSTSLYSSNTSTTLDPFVVQDEFLNTFGPVPKGFAINRMFRDGSGDRSASLGLGAGAAERSVRMYLGGPDTWQMSGDKKDPDLTEVHDQRESPAFKILSFGDPALKEVSSPVTPEDLLSENTQRLIDGLIAIVLEHNNMGISAPQVGQFKRIAVIEYNGEITTLVNPELTFPDEQKFSIEEHCLSFRVDARVDRHSHVSVRALDRNGESLEFYAEGREAALIQHEFDHLNGKLFTDLI